MRNDSILYSGGPSNRDVLEQRKKRQEDSQSKRTELMPYTEQLVALVALERSKLGDKLLEIIDPDTPDDKIAVKIEAIRMHKEFLATFEIVLAKLLHVNKAKEARNAERNV